MAVLYTGKQIQDALRELRIKPTDDGLVDTREMAKLLTWRARHEQGIEHVYPEAAVRRHVELENLKIAGKKNRVANLYRLEDAFTLPLAPNRGMRQKKEKEATS